MNRRSRTIFVLLGGLAAGLVLASERVRASEAPAQPNVIVFLTDDQGWGDLGCYGHPVLKTPNLDRFATEGMRFTQFYAASAFCSPSRSAILTGRTPYRNGVFTWIPEKDTVHLRRSEITLPALLKKAGYTTCHVGKWHLNGFFNSPEQPQPNDHGYDHWFATQNNAAPNHKNPVNFVRNGEAVGPLEGFSAILVVEEAIRWLDDVRDPSKPFFMTVWTHEPHLPIESDPKFMALYDGDDDLRQHHGNVSQMDHAFGMLMEAVERHRAAENTLVIFTSDNGPEGRLDADGLPIGRNKRTRGSTGGLRGRKRDVYEGGIRVPGIVRWPGKVPVDSASDEPVVGSDIFTTVCDILDIDVPSDRTVDGASMLPAFAGRPIDRPVPLYWRCNIAQGPKTAMRIGDMKILANEELTEFEMYDVGADPHETKNLVQVMPEKFREMRERLVALNTSIESEGPDWWKDYRRPGQRAPREAASPFARDRLVAWCIVPFDARRRGPAERAEMLVRLGLKRVAYDWRDEHVATFEQEILEYQKHGLEFFAFWNEHESAFKLFEKYDLHPQIWKTCPSPEGANQRERVAAAGRQLLPLVERTRAMGCKLGLYNHGGWGGEPDNLVAVCRWLRRNARADHVGIIYNLHHGHGHIADFAESLDRMKPLLLCLNLNGMNDDANPKILPLGQGRHERQMIAAIQASGYDGPIGILDHRADVDAEESLLANLTGLDAMLAGGEREPQWQTLLPPDALGKWQVVAADGFEMHGPVAVSGGELRVGAGMPATGVRWTGEFPTANYEMELECRRTEGSDFFCGLTFPARDQALTLILGGWGGWVVGLSCIDGKYAIDNDTCQAIQFKNEQWYRVGLKVHGKKVEVAVDGKRIIDFDASDHELSVSDEMAPCRPLGIATWNTAGAIRNMRYRVVRE